MIYIYDIMISSCSRPKRLQYITTILAVLKKYLQFYKCVRNTTRAFVQYYKNTISEKFLQDITRMYLYNVERYSVQYSSNIYNVHVLAKLQDYPQRKQIRICIYIHIFIHFFLIYKYRTNQANQAKLSSENNHGVCYSRYICAKIIQKKVEVNVGR